MDKSDLVLLIGGREEKAVVPEEQNAADVHIEIYEVPERHFKVRWKTREYDSQLFAKIKGSFKEWIPVARWVGNYWVVPAEEEVSILNWLEDCPASFYIYGCPRLGRTNTDFDAGGRG